MINDIVDILVRRDGISKLEAENCVEECREALLEAFSSDCTPDDIEYIVSDYLGLEPDYIEYLL